MTLIKSISGIRGTIGGKPNDGLTPLDIVKFTCAFARFIQNQSGKKNIKVVIGRDARISGEMVRNLVVGSLQGMGADVIDLGLSTTPTVEVAVPEENADAGIILTASHNPRQWNALKLLNGKGEFISADEGAEVLRIADQGDIDFADVDDLGSYTMDASYLEKHIKMVLDLPLVDPEAIRSANFTVAVDAVNSTGGMFVPALLKALGVKEVIELYCDPNGQFPHNPEPLPENLTEIASVIRDRGADVGIVVDPDVDRLAMVCEDGSMFGEEYTLVAVSDFVVSNTPGNTVSNLSSTRALRDVTTAHGQQHYAAAVGEVNVVEKMKEVSAIIGGEGNGGVIYPELHYGRDALVGIGLFLTQLAKSGMSCSQLRDSFPKYIISKNKIELTPDIDVDVVLRGMEAKYASEQVNTIDGVKIDFANEWVHLRKSNTEPIIRIYAESSSKEQADQLAAQIIKDIKELI
ncbi:MAG: phosphoglucosamine mutase [Flavobacteriales bacterium]|nr:phosphoglucosamine mutase [Flavobacteriales bacterium]